MGLDGGLMGLMWSYFVKGIKGHQGSFSLPLPWPLPLEGRGTVPFLFTPPLTLTLGGAGECGFYDKKRGDYLRVWGEFANFAWMIVND